MKNRDTNPPAGRTGREVAARNGEIATAHGGILTVRFLTDPRPRYRLRMRAFASKKGSN